MYVTYVYICIYRERQSKRHIITHELGQMIYGSTLLIPMKQRVFNKSSKKHSKTG